MTVYVLKALTVMLACITIGSYLGGLDFVLDILSHFKVQYAVLFLLFGAAFGFLKQPVWLAVSLVGMAANLASIVPWYVDKNAWLASDTGNSIKILVSNVSIRSTNYADLLKLVEEEQPQILGLLEVNDNWLAAIASLRNVYEYRFEYPTGNHQGLALFSMLPILESNVVWFGETASPAIVADVVAGGKAFELILAHPPPPLNAELATIRNLQLQKMAQHVRSSEKTVVLAGDLNTTMWSPFYTHFVEESGLINARAGYGVGATWALRSPFGIPIDHIMVSRPSRVGNFHVHDGIGSDHRPISAQVRIIRPGEGGMSNAALSH